MREIKHAVRDEIRSGKIYKKGFSASALGWGSGTCPRRWWFAFNNSPGYEVVTAKSRKNMANGTAIHDFIQKEITANVPGARVEEEFWVENPPMHGFIDVIHSTKSNQDIIFEIKSATDEAFSYRSSSGKAAAYHKLQILIYMYVKKVKLGVFMYQNKNDYDDTFIAERMDEKNLEYIKYVFDWMRKVYATYESGVVPGFFKGKRSNSKVCKECPFAQVCAETGEAPNSESIDLLVMPS